MPQECPKVPKIAPRATQERPRTPRRGFKRGPELTRSYDNRQCRAKKLIFEKLWFYVGKTIVFEGYGHHSEEPNAMKNCCASPRWRHKWTQNRTKLSQRAPRTTKKCPESAPRVFKRAPRAPKRVPRASQGRPRKSSAGTAASFHAQRFSHRRQENRWFYYVKVRKSMFLAMSCGGTPNRALKMLGISCHTLRV